MQSRYVLGDGGRSFVGGFGKKAPVQLQNEGASCPNEPTACNAVNGLLNPLANPQVLYGALVEGGILYSQATDIYSDVRSANNSRTMIEYNAGFAGLAAGLQQAPGTWEQCLQGYGQLTKDTLVCSVT